MISPFLCVPPHAQYVLSFCAMLVKLEFLSSMPSMMVFDLPNFRVSRRMRIRCCSFSISPQTHRSFGSPQVEQTSAMILSTVKWQLMYIRVLGVFGLFFLVSL